MNKLSIHIRFSVNKISQACLCRTWWLKVLYEYSTATNHSEYIIIQNALTTVQYLDLTLATVLCNVAQELAANAATTPHLIGGKIIMFFTQILI